MILVCTKCETSNRIEREGNDLHCKFCGNVVVEGVTPRWPIIEKEVFDTMKKKCRKCNKKNALVDGLCYACYKEEHGHAYKPETHRGEKKAAEKPVQEWPDKAKDQVKATVPVDVKVKVSVDKPSNLLSEMLKPEKVIVDFADYPELYNALMTEAKKDFRTAGGEILFLIQELVKIGEAA